MKKEDKKLLLNLIFDNDRDKAEEEVIKKTYNSHLDTCYIGEKCIVRTYSAGCWFGIVADKYKNEIILEKARRLWRWWAAESISLSGVALHGIKYKNSKICEALPSIWLESIEIIPCTEKAINSLEQAPICEQEK